MAQPDTFEESLEALEGEQPPAVRRCNKCRMWYDLQLASCPSCEAEPPQHNQALAAAKLNEHLLGLRAGAEQERQVERRLRSGSRNGGSPLDRPPSAFQGR